MPPYQQAELMGAEHRKVASDRKVEIGSKVASGRKGGSGGKVQRHNTPGRHVQSHPPEQALQSPLAPVGNRLLREHPPGYSPIDATDIKYAMYTVVA